MDLSLLISKSVKEIIQNSASNNKITSIIEKQKVKPHFIPIRYRILGGLLQSMNIQFGNLIEKLMSNLIEYEPKLDVINDYSGKKSKRYKISVSNEQRIDDYISRCQTNDVDLSVEYPKLLNEIISDKDTLFNELGHDIDMLFRDKNTGQIIYLEMKYNDDHDTGKFVDINRKFLKTYAYLVNEFHIKSVKELKPYLFYFTNKKMKGNIYIPEHDAILRGKEFFDKFLSISYEDVDKALLSFSEDNSNIKTFDELYNKIMNLEI